MNALRGVSGSWRNLNISRNTNSPAISSTLPRYRLNDLLTPTFDDVYSIDSSLNARETISSLSRDTHLKSERRRSRPILSDPPASSPSTSYRVQEDICNDSRYGSASDNDLSKLKRSANLNDLAREGAGGAESSSSYQSVGTESSKAYYLIRGEGELLGESSTIPATARSIEELYGSAWDLPPRLNDEPIPPTPIIPPPPVDEIAMEGYGSDEVFSSYYDEEPTMTEQKSTLTSMPSHVSLRIREMDTKGRRLSDPLYHKVSNVFPTKRLLNKDTRTSGSSGPSIRSSNTPSYSRSMYTPSPTSQSHDERRREEEGTFGSHGRDSSRASFPIRDSSRGASLEMNEANQVTIDQFTPIPPVPSLPTSSSSSRFSPDYTPSNQSSNRQGRTASNSSSLPIPQRSSRRPSTASNSPDRIKDFRNGSTSNARSTPENGSRKDGDAGGGGESGYEEDTEADQTYRRSLDVIRSGSVDGYVRKSFEGSHPLRSQASARHDSMTSIASTTGSRYSLAGAIEGKELCVVSRGM